MPEGKTRHHPNRADIAMASLAIFSLTLLFISFIFDPTSTQKELFGRIDSGICAVFIAELGFRSHHAHSKRQFLRESWADILGSIPSPMMAMRTIREFGLFRIAKVARAARATKTAKVAKLAKVSRAKGAKKVLGLVQNLLGLKETAKGFVRKLRRRLRL